MKKTDVVAIGECLIDFIPAGVNDLGAPLYSANTGGAPANVLAMVAKLGGSTAFIGKVGRDGFGTHLMQQLQTAGVGIDGMVADADYNTTLAFVHLDESGDRSFSFYRKNGADCMLTAEEIPADLVEHAAVMHFGSVSMTDEPSRTATLAAVERAKACGALISYDPNYRPLLWADTAEAADWMRRGAMLADVIKVSDEELTLITGETDYAAGAEALCGMGASLVFVTLGEHGSFFYNRIAQGLLPAFDVSVVDTTGSGDTFFGAVLWSLRGKTAADLAALTARELMQIVRFGNAAGGLTATKKGAIPAMPTYDEIAALANAPVRAGVVYDMHTHSEHSHDSTCPIADMAASETAQGIAGFAVTDHCDIEYYDTQPIEAMVAGSVADAAAQNAATDGVEILRGVEIGEGFWHLPVTQQMVAAHDYDVVIGSVHAVQFEKYTMPFSTIDFAAMGAAMAADYFEAYLNDLHTMLLKTSPDIMAHLTCPLRYMNGKYGLGIDCRRYAEKIEEILKLIIRRGIALEVNTSCVGGGYDELMPEEWIIERYAALGGYLVTLGSDAHIAPHAAHAFDRALACLKKHGFDHIYYYKNRRAFACAIGG